MIHTAKVETLEKFILEAFRKENVSTEVAELACKGMIHTSLRGVDTHGIRLLAHYLKGYRKGRLNPSPNFNLNRTNQSTAIFDADHSIGYAGCMVAMNHAIEIAKEVGVGFVSVKNSSHCGALSYYGFEAAKHDMIGLGTTHATPRMKSPGSNQAFLGTNPICFTAPTSESEPLCYDSAPTMVPFHKILDSRESGESLPDGVAADSRGNVTKDPNLAQFLLPIGDYKGFGLSLIADILSALLSGMPIGPDISQMYGDMSKKRYLGQFFGAIKIEAFEDPEIFKNRLSITAEMIRNQKNDGSNSKNYIPGDPEKNSFNERYNNGIPLSDIDREKFEDIAKRYSINPIKFI
tara:strand:- start:1002 stop:2048 length:1047 start_codon:yes stop_codon:yes gene_type:complete